MYNDIQTMFKLLSDIRAADKETLRKVIAMQQTAHNALKETIRATSAFVSVKSLKRDLFSEIHLYSDIKSIVGV